MKRFFALCLVLTLFISCSIDDDAISFDFEFLPVESVDIPTEFELGETYPITVSYFSPSTCHRFKEFYCVTENNQHTIAPITFVFNQDNCEALENELVEKTFNFTATNNGSYIFRFWQGKDDNGEGQYLTIEIPVIE